MFSGYFVSYDDLENFIADIRSTTADYEHYYALGVNDALDEIVKFMEENRMNN